MKFLIVLVMLVAPAVGQSLPPPIVTAPPDVIAAVQPTPPSQAIDDPLVNPAAAIDDAAAAKRHGWPALVIAVAIMLAYAARSAGARWPSVAWLSWLNTGKRAFAIAGVITVGSAVFDVLVMGGTAYAAGYAGLFAVIALLNAKGPQ